MSRLESLTYITLGDIASDLSLHLMPPILLLQILIHLCSSGVDRIKSIMGFFQNSLLQLGTGWHTDRSFIPQNSIIFGESRYFSYSDMTFDSVDTSISF